MIRELTEDPELASKPCFSTSSLRVIITWLNRYSRYEKKHVPELSGNFDEFRLSFVQVFFFDVREQFAESELLALLIIIIFLRIASPLKLLFHHIENLQDLGPAPIAQEIVVLVVGDRALAVKRVNTGS